MFYYLELRMLQRILNRFKRFGCLGEFLFLAGIIFSIELAWQVVRLVATGQLSFDWLYQ
jgi:hypothetical protein